MRHVAFIGFGEAARAFAQSLREVAPLRMTAYDILIHGDLAGPLRDAAGALDVTLTCSAGEAVTGAGMVFSAVTAGSASAALAGVYDAPVHPHVLCDINSVTAACKAANAARVRAAGAAYVDMAVMAPVHPARHRTPVLLAGDVAAAEPALRALDFHFDIAGPNPGDATAVKMVRSLFVKGLEALTVQTLTAAEASGCGERILASLHKSYPGLNLPAFAAYQFDRVVTHGRRRAEEVREVAQTLRDLGFHDGAALAEAVADVQAAVAAARPALDPDPRACARAAASALRPPISGAA
jgi:3-hydroxyisobutyrate dehydrogenase-like beta-hydroxyacid dehydrogenase